MKKRDDETRVINSRKVISAIFGVSAFTRGITSHIKTFAPQSQPLGSLRGCAVFQG